MEALKKLLRNPGSRPKPLTDQEMLNVAREYLQTLSLKFIFQSKWGGALSFMGGTCLRMCYDLKRYSEDLDFAYDDHAAPYSFPQLVTLLQREFRLLGFDVATNVHDDKIVQKAFLRFSHIPEALGLSGFRKEQKLHIKLEVDVKPPPLVSGERESFFVNRFQEMFPILKHTLPTLFAGKILAILFRPYARGRDYYDLIWYLSQKTELNLAYLNRGMKEVKFGNAQEVFGALEKKIQAITPSHILKDMDRFLEDPKEVAWLKRYHEVFRQLTTA